MSARAQTRESGVALLIVLLAITLLTIVVVELTYSSQVETHLAIGGRNALQAYYLARSGVNVAEAILVRDLDVNGPTDGESDIWAQALPPLPVGDGTVMLHVTDESRLLDVNALAKKDVFEVDPARQIFRGLFEILGLERPLLSAVIDWLDQNETPETEPPGAEQPFYLGRTPPVRVRNGPVLSVRDLLDVRGMTPELLARLEPFVTALPQDASTRGPKVNVNTAPAEVLYALSPGLARERGIVDQLLAARRERPFKDSLALQTAVPQLKNAKLWSTLSDRITYGSTYFRIEAVGTVGGIARGLTVVVKRGEDNRPRAITRVRWTPSVAPAALTSLPPSDFLETLPPLGGG